MELRKVAYRRVRYPRLEFRTGELALVLPAGVDPETVVNKHGNWVNDKQSFINECLKDAKKKKRFDRSVSQLKDIVNSLIKEAETDYGVKINKTRFLKMKTKWASCSDSANLTLNTLLRHLPEPIIKYVIFHETAHLLEKRHNDHFWSIISARFSDHNALERELFTYWFLIQHELITSN